MKYQLQKLREENLGYNKAIYCKPGIRLDKTNDNFDQKYSGFTTFWQSKLKGVKKVMFYN